MVRFTLKQCAHFIAVAEYGGIAQAARRLNISQPALAQSIGKLEQMTGLTLLRRLHARGTEVTAQGAAFLVHARALSDHAKAVEREAVTIAADLNGTLRLGCFHTIAPFHLAALARDYHALYPGVAISPSEQRQDELVAGLASGELDLALTYDMGLTGAAIERDVLCELRPHILLPSGHARAAQPAIDLADMADEPFVLFDGPASREYFANLLNAHRIDPPVAFRSGSIESVRSAVGNGFGFSLSVMRPPHDGTYDGHRVVRVPIAGDVAPVALVLARAKGRGGSGLHDNFSAFCKAHFAGIKV